MSLDWCINKDMEFVNGKYYFNQPLSENFDNIMVLYQKYDSGV